MTIPNSCTRKSGPPWSGGTGASFAFGAWRLSRKLPAEKNGDGWRVTLEQPKVELLEHYGGGCTSMIAVRSVSEAIAGAIERGKAGEVYVAGDENHTRAEMLGMCGKAKALGKPKKVYSVPYRMIKASLSFVKLHDKMKGKGAGLHYTEFAKLQTRNTFLDCDPVAGELGYSRGGIEAATQDVVDARPPRSLLKKKK